MRFQVLGSVVAYGERGPVPLGPARQRTVLAVLLVEAGMPVSFDRLMERVWGASPPRSARQTLHTYLSRLRSVLGGAGPPVLARRHHSYQLEVDTWAVDLHRFRALAAEARQVNDEDRAVALWCDALELWRGAPFADLESDWLRTTAAGLEAERLAAMLDRNDVLLRRGEHTRLAPELSAAAAEHPLDERLAEQLMLALYRSGRPAGALAHYRLVQDRLADEVGSDPGPALRELHRRILWQEEPAAPAPAPAAAPVAADRPTAPPAVVAAQLPGDVAGFTGRAEALRRLDALLGPVGDPPSTVTITAIGGSAGIGKTALAVHWAHRVRDRFPDGQLYVNLRGYDPDQPMPPADALARFLTALGVSGQDIPLELDDRAARYRSELSGRRMLIVLDNAASVAQVRPLLPGSRSCVVVVTSRDSLGGLVAVHGAHRLDLDLLVPGEAVDLLHRLIGPRVEAEPAATATLAEQCARLPLALRIAAELAASRPESRLADLVAELADRQARLQLLDAGGDSYAAVREVLSWSIQHLPAAAARTFRLLGLHPGPDLDPYAAAVLAGTGLGQARRMLELLARAHLVHRTARGRYGMHDLLRAYAIHLATVEETDPLRHAAQQRLLDYYLATAVAATDVLHPAEAHYRPEAGASPNPIPDLASPAAAHAWLEAERFCLVAIAAHAAADGRASYVVGLSQTLHRYLGDAHLTDMLAINDLAFKAAEQAGDLAGQGHALRALGMAYNRLGQYDTALEHCQQARARFRQAGDLGGEALALTGHGLASYRLGNHKHAVDDHLQSVDLARRAGDRLSEALALGNLGVVAERLGRYTEAAERHHQTLAIVQELGARRCEGITLSNLANVELRQGEYPLAGEHLQQALAILQQFDSPIAEAHTLDTLGILHLRRGEPELATGYFQRALDAYRRTGERNGQAWAINGLGEAAQLAGRPAAALAFHADALIVAVETEARHQQARAHAGLGHAHRALGEPDQARTHYEQAYALYTELDMPDAEDIRAYLATTAPTRRGPTITVGYAV